MQATLHGPRITLRTLTEGDAEEMLRAVRDPELRRLTGTHRAFTEADILEWARSRADAPGRYDWAVVETATGAYLGDCSLNEIDPDNLTAGYRIAISRPGEGFGTEATDAVLAFAFGELGLHRVELEVFAFNERARKSYEKSGFTVEGVKRSALRWGGGRHDAIMMAALAPAGNPQLPATVDSSGAPLWHTEHDLGSGSRTRGGQAPRVPPWGGCDPAATDERTRS